jgi:hypothetical protein
MDGMSKYNSFDSAASWFGNPDLGLGLPMPWLIVFLETAAKFSGSMLLHRGLLDSSQVSGKAAGYRRKRRVNP